MAPPQFRGARPERGADVMKILLRVDASVEMGSGHVMRCLTLADSLRARGGRCTFICRTHRGHLADFIRDRGHEVRLLPEGREAGSDQVLAHADWLGASRAEDVVASVAIARETRPDWLIADHYALDEAWERAMRPHVGRIMVVDDLADRRHDCDLLLDQNLGRTARDYQGLVPDGATVLVGTAHALLRPEFVLNRPRSLARRSEAHPRTVLISLGGADKDNYTRRTLELIGASDLCGDAVMTVVLGAGSPWIDDISSLARSLSCRTDVLIQSDRMAELMADADVAVGGAGATTWERACLGVPSALWVMADNQRAIAAAMEDSGAAMVLDPAAAGGKMSMLERLNSFFQDGPALASMSRRAAAIVDGLGVNRVLQSLSLNEQRS